MSSASSGALLEGCCRVWEAKKDLGREFQVNGDLLVDLYLIYWRSCDIKRE